MNKTHAMYILNISIHEPISDKLLRKKYLSASLKYHPDKNINTDTIPFHEIKDAYEFMLQLPKDDNTSQYNISIYKILIQLYKLYKCHVIELEPTLNMLLNKEVYYASSYGLYIPLWHESIYFEDKGLFVKILPRLPDYISIDTDNNILMHLDVSNKCIGDIVEFKYFNLTYTFNYDGTNTKIYEKCGIPLIKKNIYAYEDLSNVIFTFLTS